MTQNTKIFSRFWVARSTEDSLAYLCHLGDGKENEEARQKTGRQRIGKFIECGIQEEEFDNAPTSGFEIVDHVKTSDGNVVWSMRDPRGFDVAIQSRHLMDLIENCTIENCTIQDKLVWARSDNLNVLLSVTSEAYQNAIDGDRHALIKQRTIPPMHSYRSNGSDQHYLGKNREGDHIKARWYPVGAGYLYADHLKSAPRAKTESVTPIDPKVFQDMMAKAKSSGTLWDIPAAVPVEFVFVEKRDTVRIVTYSSARRGEYVKVGDHFLLLNSIWNPQDFRAYRADGSVDVEAAVTISAKIWDHKIGWGGQRSATLTDAEIYKLT